MSGKEIAYKVREDPLHFIKKKEQENIRSIMSNPLALKDLQKVCDLLFVVHLLFVCCFG
jgi:hypothetical protein